MATHNSSPTRLAPPSQLINNPPSPRTHRALRRLQSAHSLGQSNNSQSSLISQQHKQTLHKSSIPNLQHPTQHTRVRSNSDASNMTPTSTGAGSRRPMLVKRPTAEGLSLDKLVRDGPPDGDLAGALESTRLKILDQGIKSDSDGMSSLRVYVWLILLNAPIVSTDAYLALIHRSASPSYSKIRNDTFRTLATDPLFRRRVSEASLIRLLNAIAWKLHDAQQEALLHNPPQVTETTNQHNKSLHTSNPQGSPELHTSSPHTSRPARTRASTLTTESPDSDPQQITYVQGMNVLCAPFLYASRSESQAFTLFHTLITRELPAYVSPTMRGVHLGLALVDKVLAIVDPKLSLYLIGKGMTAEIYGFASVLTLCACTPPLPEVLRLWDFLFAYGAHLNILCIVAQLVILREDILKSPSPTKILRSFPPLQAEMIKVVTLTLIKKIPDDVYAEIVNHAK